MDIDDQDLLANLGLWIAQGDDEINQAEYLLNENPDDIKGRLLHVIDFIEQEVRITNDNNGKVVVLITAELNERISDAIFEDVHTGLENALSEIIDMTEETRDTVTLYSTGLVIIR